MRSQPWKLVPKPRPTITISYEPQLLQEPWEGRNLLSIISAHTSYIVNLYILEPGPPKHSLARFGHVNLSKCIRHLITSSIAGPGKF